MLHIAQEAFRASLVSLVGLGACPDRNGKAIYRGASELLPPPQGALLLSSAVGGTGSSAGCGFCPQGLVGHVSISIKDGATVGQAGLGLASGIFQAWSQDLESGFRAAPFTALQPAGWGRVPA